MKWLLLEKEKPHSWNWVITGYINDHDSMVYQIARWNPQKNEFEMWNMSGEFGPTEADAFWNISPKQVTHWLEIPYLSEEK